MQKFSIRLFESSTNEVRTFVAGHSLGASVAEISALDLLYSAAQNSEPEPNLKVIGFAAPAIGNQALADFVRQHGWHKHIQNYVLPGLLRKYILQSCSYHACESCRLLLFNAGNQQCRCVRLIWCQYADCSTEYPGVQLVLHQFLCSINCLRHHHFNHLIICDVVAARHNFLASWIVSAVDCWD